MQIQCHPWMLFNHFQHGLIHRRRDSIHHFRQISHGLVHMESEN